MAQFPRVLIQLDSDRHASSFDAIVAIDAGTEHLLQYAHVTPESVESLVHGAIFTRGSEELARTAIFIGGADIAVGEQILAKVTQSFFGPLRVSVMLDSNGANTTAVAAVLAAEEHLPLSQMRATILGATGPVGRRIAAFIVRAGGRVHAVSRSRQRAEALCQQLRDDPAGHPKCISPIGLDEPQALVEAYQGSNVVVSSGAAGVTLTRLDELAQFRSVQVAIDLNAVPPAGIDGIAATDRGLRDGGLVRYGALGIGRTKMKLHREAIRRLFTQNDLVLDAPQLLAMGREWTQESSV